MVKIYVFPFGFALWSFVSFGSQPIGKKGKKENKNKNKTPQNLKDVWGGGRGEGSKLETPWNKQK